jgi:rSAM/selenodomain-associated transferase 1
MEPYQTKKDRIIIFMRAPEIGKVKTRLSENASPGTALDLYKCFAMDVLHTAQETKIEITIFFHPPESESLISQWIGGQYDFYPQKGKDLGLRMADAFARTFSAGYHRAILIGTDCPEMSSDILKEAFEGIQNTGCVIGPSKDGGYYLIGFSTDAFTDHPFHEMVWGTEKVCQQTLERCSQKNINPHILPELNDIDTWDDLRLFRKHQKKSKHNTKTIRYLITNRILEDE